MIKYFCDRCGKEIVGKVNEYTDTTEAINPHTKKVVATWKSVEHICDECEQKELTCGFKVGDQVITSMGEVGTIKEFCDCDRCKERGFFEPRIETEIGNWSIWITDTDKENGFKSFYKIGDHIFGNIDEQDVLDNIEYKKDSIRDLQKHLIELEAQLNVVRKLKENNNGN